MAIFPANGRVNAVSAARSLLGWGIERFVCVTDRDFEDPEGRGEIAQVLYPYDRRDLESMLVALGVLALVLDHQGSRDKIAAEGGSGMLVQRIEKVVEPITRLRAWNAEDGLALAFDEVDLASKVDQRLLALAVQSYCAALVGVSATSATIPEAVNVAESSDEQVPDPSGKDVITVAGVALRKVAGTLSKAAAAEPQLSAQVRSSAGLALSRSDWMRGLISRLSA
ncbi:hypothetical protein [Kribbella sindirgiensis]|uniref:Uncharacterized protein n=1 Tax=Kribbella sindirgiensis TaxID=1124744 RepID=A0A4R0IQ18_9ACTN|nr:hypothetical protein [Kribbella sindirgiensis]TCC35077.1 hypothetical protein E0H50_14510 [Kribbella sindirgiensis]